MRFGFLAALACLSAVVTSADEPVLLATQSDGQVAMSEGGTLAVRGIVGQISIRPGKDGNLRFAAARPDDRKKAVPLALWERGNTLEIAPPEGGTEGPVVLEAVLPLGAAVRVDAHGSTIVVRSMERRVEISGSDLDFRLTGLRGSASVDVERGTGTLEAIAGEVTLRGEDVQAIVRTIGGPLAASLSGGRLEASALDAGADLDVFGTEVSIAQGRGPLKVSARNGSLAVREFDGHAEIRADGAGVSLEKVKGDFGIETDDQVRFRGIEADLHVDGYGASVAGTGSTGIIEVKTDDGTVQLEDVGGAVRVQGARVDARLVRVGGDVLVRTSMSQVRVHAPSAKVEIEAEGGNVEIVNPTGAVSVAGDPDDVRVTESNAPLQIDVESDEVLVHWVSMAFQDETRVENRRGRVRAHLSGGGGACRVEAKSEYGTVESAVPTVKVLEDGKTASGVVGAGSGARPTVWLNAQGDILVTTEAWNAEAAQD